MNNINKSDNNRPSGVEISDSTKKINRKQKKEIQHLEYEQKKAEKLAQKTLVTSQKNEASSSWTSWVPFWGKADSTNSADNKELSKEEIKLLRKERKKERKKLEKEASAQPKKLEKESALLPEIKEEKEADVQSEVEEEFTIVDIGPSDADVSSQHTAAKIENTGRLSYLKSKISGATSAVLGSTVHGAIYGSGWGALSFLRGLDKEKIIRASEERMLQSINTSKGTEYVEVSRLIGAFFPLLQDVVLSSVPVAIKKQVLDAFEQDESFLKNTLELATAFILANLTEKVAERAKERPELSKTSPLAAIISVVLETVTPSLNELEELEEESNEVEKNQKQLAVFNKIIGQLYDLLLPEGLSGVLYNSLPEGNRFTRSVGYAFGLAASASGYALRKTGLDNYYKNYINNFIKDLLSKPLLELYQSTKANDKRDTVWKNEIETALNKKPAEEGAKVEVTKKTVGAALNEIQLIGPSLINLLKTNNATIDNVIIKITEGLFVPTDKKTDVIDSLKEAIKEQIDHDYFELDDENQKVLENLKEQVKESETESEKSKIVAQLAHLEIGKQILYLVKNTLRTEDPFVTKGIQSIERILQSTVLGLVAKEISWVANNTDELKPNEILYKTVTSLIAKYQDVKKEAVTDEAFWVEFFEGLPLPGFLKDNIKNLLQSELGNYLEKFDKGRKDLSNLKDTLQQNLTNYSSSNKFREEIVSISSSISDKVTDAIFSYLVPSKDDGHTQLRMNEQIGEIVGSILNQYLPGYKPDPVLKKWLEENVVVLLSGAQNAEEVSTLLRGLIKEFVEVVVLKTIHHTLTANSLSVEQSIPSLLSHFNTAFTTVFAKNSEAELDLLARETEATLQLLKAEQQLDEKKKILQKEYENHLAKRPENLNQQEESFQALIDAYDSLQDASQISFENGLKLNQIIEKAEALGLTKENLAEYKMISHIYRENIKNKEQYKIDEGYDVFLNEMQKAIETRKAKVKSLKQRMSEIVATGKESDLSAIFNKAELKTVKKELRSLERDKDTGEKIHSLRKLTVEQLKLLSEYSHAEDIVLSSIQNRVQVQNKFIQIEKKLRATFNGVDRTWTNALEWFEGIKEPTRKLNELKKEQKKLSSQIEQKSQTFFALSSELQKVLGLDKKDNIFPQPFLDLIPPSLQEPIWDVVDSLKVQAIGKLLLPQIGPMVIAWVDRAKNERELVRLSQGSEVLPALCEGISEDIIGLVTVEPYSKTIRKLNEEFPIGANQKQLADLIPVITRLALEPADFKSNLESLFDSWSYNTHYEINQATREQWTNRLQEHIIKAGQTVQPWAASTANAIPGATQELQDVLVTQFQNLMAGGNSVLEANRGMLKDYIKGVLLQVFAKFAKANFVEGQSLSETFTKNLADVINRAVESVGDREISREEADELAENTVRLFMAESLELKSEEDFVGLPTAAQNVTYQAIVDQIKPLITPMIEVKTQKDKIDRTTGNSLLTSIAKELSQTLFADQVIPRVSSYTSIAHDLLKLLKPNLNEDSKLFEEPLIEELLDLVQKKSLTNKAILGAYERIAGYIDKDQKKSFLKKLKSVNFKNKLSSVAMTPEEMAAKATELFPNASRAQVELGQSLRALLTDQNDPAHQHLMNFVQPYLEGMILRIFAKLTDKYGNNTLEKVTKEILNLLGTRANQYFNKEVNNKPIEEEILEIFMIRSADDLIGLPKPLQAMVYNLIKNQVKGIAEGTYAKFSDLRDGSGKVKATKDRLKEKLGYNYVEGMSQALGQLVMKAVPATFAKEVNGAPKGVTQIEEPIRGLLYDLAQGNNQIAKTVITWLETEEFKTLKEELGKGFVSLAKKDQELKEGGLEWLPLSKAVGGEFVANYMLDPLEKLLGGLVAVENEKGVKLNQTLISRFLDAAAEHFTIIAQANKKGKLTDEAYVTAAKNESKLHAAIPDDEVNYWFIANKLNRKVFNEEIDEEKLGKYIAELASKDKQGEPIRATALIEWLKSGGIDITEKQIAEIKKREGSFIKAIRTERDKHEAFKKEHFYGPKTDKLVELLAPPKAEQGPEWNLFKNQVLPMLLPMIYDILLDSIKGLVRTGLETALVKVNPYKSAAFNIHKELGRKLTKKQIVQLSEVLEKRIKRSDELPADRFIDSLDKILKSSSQKDQESMRSLLQKHQTQIDKIITDLWDDKIASTKASVDIESPNIPADQTAGELDESIGRFYLEAVKLLDLPSAAAYLLRTEKVKGAVLKSLGSSMRGVFNETFIKDKLKIAMEKFSAKEENGEFWLNYNPKTDEQNLLEEGYLNTDIQELMEEVANEAFAAPIKAIKDKIWGAWDTVCKTLKIAGKLRQGLETIFDFMFVKVIGSIVWIVFNPIYGLVGLLKNSLLNKIKTIVNVFADTDDKKEARLRNEALFMMLGDAFEETLTSA